MISPDGSLFHNKKGKPVEVPAPLAPLADTHGHLTSLRSLEASEAVARAAVAGVRLLVVPVDPSDDVQDASEFLDWFNRTVEGAARLLDDAMCEGVEPPRHAPQWEVPALTDNVHFIAGIHPYGAGRFLTDPLVGERLGVLLGDERCVGMGEFGLDYGPWNEVAPDIQAEAFRRQLRLAHEEGLPVELHLRDANDDLSAEAHMDALRILEEEGVPEAGCDLHCFTCGPEVMAPFVELGCHIAFGGAATFSRSDDIRAAVAACPDRLILTETDSPYMAPVPLRGQECEPAMVALTAALVASVREDALGAAPSDTYARLWENANTFFGLGAWGSVRE